MVSYKVVEPPTEQPAKHPRFEGGVERSSVCDFVGGFLGDFVRGFASGFLPGG